MLIAIASALTAAELLALRDEFGRHGVFDTHVLGATRPGAVRRRLPLVSMPRVAGARLAFAVMVIVLVAFDVSPSLPLVVLAATTLLWPYLLPYGGDGSDAMARMLSITVAIAFLLVQHTLVIRIALVFIAAQLCLAYGASGVAKLFGRPWRSGTAVQAILHTAFGHPGMMRAALDRWPNAGKLLTWLVIGVEISFPIGVVLGGWLAFAALTATAMLQLAIAVAMGLSRFTPWFFAAFPATAWAACHYGILSA